jgi:aminoglycoside phosphotransferase (APT) family kinase protein
MSEPLSWPVIGARLERELGEPAAGARLLAQPWRSRATWAVRTRAAGELVVKVRHGDRALEKTQWCAARLPLLGARGYPVPVIVWHGLLTGEWHVVVQRRLPGRPVTALTRPLLGAVLDLVALQADAGIPADDRDFAGYVANVLFDDWDEVWADALSAGPGAGELCERVAGWLQPVWGLRLPPADFAHNDLNLANVLTDGTQITGVVDWDEFGLGSRALDLIALAFDCERDGNRYAAGRLYEHAVSAVGTDGLRLVASYRMLAYLADFRREGQPSASGASVRLFSAILSKLEKTYG